MITLTVCRWDGSRSRENTVDNPSPSAIEDAVRALNGRDLNDLYLRHDSGRWMGAGGGPDRIFVSFSGGPEGPFDGVVAAHASPGTELVIIGGQLARIDRKHLVPADVAIRLLLDFLDGGERSTAASWERL